MSAVQPGRPKGGCSGGKSQQANRFSLGTLQTARDDRSLNFAKLFSVPALLDDCKIGPGAKERAHAPAEQVENFVDIVPLKKLMERTLDHSAPSDMRHHTLRICQKEQPALRLGVSPGRA
jgi:hypothetical protein